MKVGRGIIARRVARSATMSYLRVASFRSEPSPNHPPLVTPRKVVDLPSGETLVILTSPSMMPTQFSTGSPLRHTKAPDGTSFTSGLGLDAGALVRGQRLRPEGGVEKVG